MTAVVVKAPLGRLADPTDTSYIPRPDWYFLFLFQTLKLLIRISRGHRERGPSHAGRPGTSAGSLYRSGSYKAISSENGGLRKGGCSSHQLDWPDRGRYRDHAEDLGHNRGRTGRCSGLAATFTRGPGWHLVFPGRTMLHVP